MPMITIHVELRRIPLSEHQQGLATGAHARPALGPVFLSEIAPHLNFKPAPPLSLDESTLGRMVNKYSEQLVFQPLAEIHHWFAYTAGAFLEPGYPPLYYYTGRNSWVSPNKSAVSAVGEGVAGFIAQRNYRCRKIARPNHDYPDVVMNESATTFLVEAKATLSSSEDNFLAMLDDELPRLACLASSCVHLDPRPAVGLLIGTILESETRYRSYITEIVLS